MFCLLAIMLEYWISRPCKWNCTVRCSSTCNLLYLVRGNIYSQCFFSFVFFLTMASKFSASIILPWRVLIGQLLERRILELPKIGYFTLGWPWTGYFSVMCMLPCSVQIGSWFQLLPRGQFQSSNFVFHNLALTLFYVFFNWLNSWTFLNSNPNVNVLTLFHY